MTEPKDGLLYMLAFCLMLALVMLLKGTPPPLKHAVMHMDDPQETQRERNARQK